MTTSLRHGTEKEHRGTLERAKSNGLSYVWSGDIRRNLYLAENLQFGVDNNILIATYTESEQESGWRITWC